MTGFGAGAAELGSGRLSLEVRSLNHRYLDVRVRMPPELSDHAALVEQLARARLSRGRYDIGVRLDGAALSAAELDVARARSAYHELARLRDELAPGTPLPVTVLSSLPDLYRPRSPLDQAGAERALGLALDRALSTLDSMRVAEGAALARELEERLVALRELRARLQGGTRGLAEAALGRLRERLERLLADRTLELERGRLEVELALLADRSDVTEELVRLGSHFEQLASLIGSDAAVGRQLDFLLQEVARETNTIGAKSQDAALAHLVVEMKAEIERMREQVQNVE
ncbi:MAG: YicC family protein [Sorangiineae bacterium]|nr:YicC family protein [Polyangiaceae bacterium]MEB2322286.1 YicC family protein [Sorangiineae bacterium]